MSNVFRSIAHFVQERLSLHDDKASDLTIIESFTNNVEFKGTNLLTLIFAIFVASIGLNINSTAVIIGAMLISPVMGPIMGIGLGIGIFDTELINKALKNLLIAVVVSITVSWLYFNISPLRDVQSELLARTTPSLWDVFIAFFGGLAGAVGSTRKEKSNVIPGVAIATALMPPLCTAGFGLSNGNIFYFLGALYLFFINSVFICLSTYLVAVYLRLPRKSIPDKRQHRNVMRYIAVIVVITVLPSIYLAYRIVDRSIFESNANRFISQEVKFPNTYLVNKTLTYSPSKRKIDLLLVGSSVKKEKIDSIRGRLPLYNLQHVSLQIFQGLNEKPDFDAEKVKASIMQDILTDSKDNAGMLGMLSKKEGREFMSDTSLRNEILALYPGIVQFNVSKLTIRYRDTAKVDTITTFTATYDKKAAITDESKFRAWIRLRLKVDTVDVILRPATIRKS